MIDTFRIETFLLPRHTRQETPINPHSFGHFNLGPAAFLMQFFDSCSELNEQVLWH